MEAKEKAKELVEKFLGKIPFADTKVYKDWKKEMNNKAKQCALIAVQEICEAIHYHYDDSTDIEWKYWQNVKREIDNL
jgi:hypothetical protein